VAKLSKAEREECEKNLAVCQAAVATFQKILREDDAADKAAKAADDRALISGIAERDGTAAAILAIREMPHRGGSGE
jgi:hypothetical protein